MRCDSQTRYAKVRFNMNREPFLELLDSAGFETRDWSWSVRTVGHAANTLGPIYLTPLARNPIFFEIETANRIKGNSEFRSVIP